LPATAFLCANGGSGGEGGAAGVTGMLLPIDGVRGPCSRAAAMTPHLLNPGGRGGDGGYGMGGGQPTGGMGGNGTMPVLPIIFDSSGGGGGGGSCGRIRLHSGQLMSTNATISPEPVTM